MIIAIFIDDKISYVYILHLSQTVSKCWTVYWLDDDIRQTYMKELLYSFLLTRATFFYLMDYVAHRPEKLGFKKKDLKIQ